MTCTAEGCALPVNRDALCLRHKLSTVGVAGMALFKHDRYLGMTQREKDREQQNAARREGRDIMRVPGRRVSTEVHTKEGWKKV